MPDFLKIVSLIILGVFLSLICYLVVEYTSRQPARRRKHEVSPPIQRQANEERIRRIDHLFDVGLVLVTILFGAELQYVSATRNTADVTFTFRVFTILLVLLIISWIIRELIPNAKLRIVVRNFCWGFVSMIIALEGLSFFALSSFTDPNQLRSITSVLFVLSFLFTILIIWTYRRLGSESVHSPSLIGSIVWSIVESILDVSVSYFVILYAFILYVLLGL